MKKKKLRGTILTQPEWTKVADDPAISKVAAARALGTCIHMPDDPDVTECHFCG